MTAITLRGLTKRYGRTTAVDGVELTIPSGDLFFLLGPSGCGKTTLLRMIAGFIEPTEGRVLFDQTDVTTLPANRRNVGMVFQSYALWPHMTVLENVAFGLKVRKLPKQQRQDKAMKALDLVQMRDFAARKPNQLSGGQQQRVALARALVIEPTILLLDEPLSNLDAKLRLDMRGQIRQICDSTGVTAVYVTHDQKEALSMADTVAVLRNGKVVQIGPPRELYERPSSRFVADFLGETNFMPAQVLKVTDSSVELQTPAGLLVSTMRIPSHVPPTGLAMPRPMVGAQVTCSIRPEAIRIVHQAPSRNGMTGRCVQTTYLGEMAQFRVQLRDGFELKVLLLHPPSSDKSLEHMNLEVDSEDVIIISE